MEISIFLPVNYVNAAMLLRTQMNESSTRYASAAAAFETYLQDYKVEARLVLVAIFPGHASAFSTMATTETSRKIHRSFCGAATTRAGEQCTPEVSQSPSHQATQ
ncbi:hypothetical protein [Xanthomonas arboricola]|uniref:hypothetical protein n=1 Tax=Xanthomonas arboricola TaxID=56448 RepID=UPI0015E0F3A6|nr:hypothetical protein [Xanthomonas arboricola]